MGGKLGTIFARAGHEVVFSYACSPKKLEKLARDAKIPKARIVSAFNVAHTSSGAEELAKRHRAERGAVRRLRGAAPGRER
jgi:hypothetical protein